jgi:AraC-like DNA-binding protein
VKRRPTGKLSTIENEVIAEIRALKASPPVGFASVLLESPARTTHHFILSSHGNVHLRLTIIAQELGMEMRTLERLFFAEYKRTMAQCQIEARVAFSKWLLSIFPPTKISSVASSVGYSQVQDFNRFFKKHMLQSPSAWSQKERARIAREQERRSRNP